MSELEQNAVNELESRLDKLVDDELNDGEVRELLLALEAQPDAWRRCALAFVEAQTLRRDLAGIAIAGSSADDDIEYELVPARQKSTGFRLPTVAWAALAVGLLLAFTAGTTVRGWRGNSELAGNSPEVQFASTNSSAAETDSDADLENQASDGSMPAEPRETLMVSIPSSEGESDQAVDIPLVAFNKEQLEKLAQQQSAVLSDAELKTLKSTGHEVEQQRAFFPVKLNDGRQAVVPLDIVRVRYTGGWQ